MLALVLAVLFARLPSSGQANTVYEIPYRLADTKHIIVRAKLNGKGPFSFIIDTGSPALIFGRDLAKTIGVQPDKDHWVRLDRLEIEGGAVLDKVVARAEDPFQLKAMNTTGLADVEIAGVLGYNVLARFRIEIDLERSHMRWTPLDSEPAPILSLADLLHGKTLKPSPNMAGMEQMAKMASAFIPKRTNRFVLPRGLVGIELAKADDGVRVAAVLTGGPAEAAGVKVGDVIQRAVFGGKEWQLIHSEDDLRQAASAVAAGETVKFVVSRQGQLIFLVMTAGKGL